MIVVRQFLKIAPVRIVGMRVRVCVCVCVCVCPCPRLQIGVSLSKPHTGDSLSWFGTSHIQTVRKIKYV